MSDHYWLVLNTSNDNNVKIHENEKNVKYYNQRKYDILLTNTIEIKYYDK